MSVKKDRMFFICFVLLIGLGGFLFKTFQTNPVIENYKDAGREPLIYPDYTELVVPPNIAPLNFVVKEDADEYFVKIFTDNDPGISVYSRKSSIIIPLKKWRNLLSSNHNKKLFFEIYTKNSGGDWLRYERLTNTISNDQIDPWVVYRRMSPSSYHPKEMLIEQRNLSSYKETAVFDNTSYNKGCVNCHTFLNNKPGKIILGVRSLDYGKGTLLANGNNVEKIDAKFGYTSWHPNGKIVAFSINEVRQFFHSSGIFSNGVLDNKSALSYYNVESKTIKTSAQFSDPNRLETYPSWSPDGRFLYFSSAEMYWKGSKGFPPENYQQKFKYDLQRVSYDSETDTWGKLERILDSGKVGKSILLPRVSPDGRFLLFCMTDYGCFPIYQPESDLYLMDLQTQQYQKLPINSDLTEAWHSWSSNSRWIVFSSKRRDGLFTRLYLSHIDKNGVASKPFILPQKNPLYYDSLPQVYSLPEFIKLPVTMSPKKLNLKARSQTQIHVEQAITGATPSAGKADPWENPI